MSDYIHNPEPDYGRNDETDAEVEIAWHALETSIHEYNDVVRYVVGRIGFEYLDAIVEMLVDFKTTSIDEVAADISDDDYADAFREEADVYVLWLDTEKKLLAELGEKK